jgi:hypothetical protein
MTIEGVPVILEGRFEKAGVEESLERNCHERLAQDLCWICIALVYPPLPQRLSAAYSLDEVSRYLRYKVKVFAVGSQGIREEPWQEGVSFTDLVSVLRQVHQAVVSEDRLAPAVDLLRDGLAAFTTSLGMSADLSALAERLRDAMGLPQATPKKEEIEEDAS